MNRTPVTSSNIKSIGHDPATNTLEVEFNTGGIYQYGGVSAEKHQALVGAESIGKHFGQHIKSAYPVTKVK